MRVNEQLLGTPELGEPLGELQSSNPMVLEALRELVAPAGSEPGIAAQVLVRLLDLHCPGVTRVQLHVAAVVLEDVRGLPAELVRRRIRELGLADHLLGLVTQALAGHRLDGRPREELERQEVERALYLVTRLIEAQEEVDGLEACMAEAAS